MSAIAIDTSDNIVMGMTFGGSDDIDPGASVVNFTSSDPGDIGIIKYSPSATLVWSTLIPGSGVEYFRGISTNQNSEILITGEIFNSLDFDPTIGQYLVAPNAYIAKYSSQCNLMWAFSIVGEGDHVIEMPSGSIHWVGRMSICADFDPSINIQTFCPGYQSGNGMFVAEFLPPALSNNDAETIMNGITHYPNPTNNTLTISSLAVLEKIQIINIQGEVVAEYNCNSKEVVIDVSFMSDGLYFVSTTSATLSTCSRVVISH